MKGKLKKWVSGLLVMVLAVSCLLTGCGQEQSTPTVSTEYGDLPYVKLTWYIRPTAQKDMDEVIAEVNKITKKKINAEIEVKRVDPGSYEQKMKTVISAGETFDLCYMSMDYGYSEYVARGAFLSMNDLIEKYAKPAYEAIPEKFWEAPKVDGQIYGFLNYQIFAREYGMYIDKDIIEKYNFDYTKMEKVADIEPLLEQMEQNESPDKVIFSCFGKGNWEPTLYGLEALDSTLVGQRIDDKENKVINLYETEEFREFISVMRDFYQKGYIQKDAATANNARELGASGRILAAQGNYKPGGLQEYSALNNNKEAVYQKLCEPFVTTKNTLATMTCISRTSKNPERAMMFINLLNTDKELYNLLCFGIEGKHYNKVSENRIEQIPNSGYSPNVAWMFGNQFNAYVYGTQEDSVWEETIQLNNEAKLSSLFGFVVNSEDIKNEVAQCQTVIDEYLSSLASGSVDIDTVYPEFIQKLKAAGSDSLVQKVQKQVDDWKSSKN